MTIYCECGGGVFEIAEGEMQETMRQQWADFKEVIEQRHKDAINKE